MALLELPQAGNTVSNRLSDSSSHTSTPSFTAKGQTPPTAWPTSSTACSGVSILALRPNCALNLALSMRASPAATTSRGHAGPMKERVLAMRLPSQPSASAASSTVALETSNSRTRSASPTDAK